MSVTLSYAYILNAFSICIPSLNRNNKLSLTYENYSKFASEVRPPNFIPSIKYLEVVTTIKKFQGKSG